MFCGNCIKAHLKAAHIAADIPEHDAEFLRQYKILDLYETDNGITLCRECHDMFEALLCCVKVVMDSECVVMGHMIVVSNALKSCSG